MATDFPCSPRNRVLLDRCDLGLQLLAVVMLVLVGAPGGEQLAGELEALRVEGLQRAQPVSMTPKITLEV